MKIIKKPINEDPVFIYNKIILEEHKLSIVLFVKILE